MKVGELIANSQKAKLDAQNSQLEVQKLKAGIEQNKEVMSLKRQEMLQGFKRHQDELNLKNKELNQSAANNYFNISKDLVKNSAESIRHSKAPENAYEAAAGQFSDNNWGFLGKAFFKGMAIREKDKREQKEADEKKKMYDDFMQEYGDVFQYMQAATDYSNALVQRRQQKELAQKETTDFIAKIESSDLSPEQKDRLYSQYFRNLGAQMGDSAQYEGRDELGQNIMITDGEGKLGKFTNPYQIEQQVKSNQERRLQEQQRQNSSQQQVEQRAQPQQQQMPKNEEQVSNAPPMQQQQQENDQFANIEPLKKISFSSKETPGMPYDITPNANGKFYASDVSQMPQSVSQELIKRRLVVDDPNPKDLEDAKNRLYGSKDNPSLAEKYQDNENLVYRVENIEKAVNNNSWQGWSKPIQDFFSRLSSKNQNIKNIIDSGAIDLVILQKEIFGQNITQSEFQKMIEGVPNKLMGKEAALYLLNNLKRNVQQKNKNIAFDIKRSFNNLDTKEQEYVTDPDSPYNKFFPNLKKKAEADPSNPGLMLENDKNDNPPNNDPRAPIEGSGAAEETNAPNQDGILVRTGKNIIKGIGKAGTELVDAAATVGSALKMQGGGDGDGPGVWAMASENARGEAPDFRKEQNFNFTDWYHKQIGYDPKTADFWDKFIINAAAFAATGPRSVLKLSHMLGSVGASIGASMDNPYEDGTLKAKIWDFVAPIVGGVGGGLSPKAATAIKNGIANTPKAALNTLENLFANRIGKNMTKEEILDFKKLLKENFNGLNAANFPEKQDTVTKIAKNLSEKVDLDPQQIAQNKQIIAKDVSQKIGAKNLDKKKAVEAIASIEKPNAQYNKILEELKKNTEKVHFPETEAYLKDFFQSLRGSADQESKIAAKKILENLEMLSQEDNPFLNILKRQTDNNFKNFASDKNLVNTNIFKATDGKPLKGFENFVFNVGENGIDVTKLNNVKELSKIFPRIQGTEYIETKNGIIDGILNNFRLNAKQTLAVRKNIQAKFVPFVEQHTKNVPLAQFKSQLTKELRSLSKEADYALGGIAANKSSPGYALVRVLHSKGSEDLDLNKALKLLNKPEVVSSFEKISPLGSTKFFKDLKKTAVAENLKSLASDPAAVIQELMSPDKSKLYEVLLGKDYNKVITDVRWLHKVYSKANAASTAGTGASKIGGVVKTAGWAGLLKALGIPLPAGAALGFGVSKGLSGVGKAVGKRLNSNEFTKKVIARAEKNAQSK